MTASARLLFGGPFRLSSQRCATRIVASSNTAAACRRTGIHMTATARTSSGECANVSGDFSLVQAEADEKELESETTMKKKSRMDKWLNKSRMDRHLLLPPPPNPLENQDQEAALVAAAPSEHKVETVRRELAFLVDVGFPTPARLTDKQWARLASLSERDYRNKYLDAVSQGLDEDLWPAISADDSAAARGPDFSPAAFAAEAQAEGLSDAEELEKRLRLASDVFSAMREAGRDVPASLTRARDRRELLRCRSREDFARILHFLGRNRATDSAEMVFQRARQRRRQASKEQFVSKREELEADGKIVYATFSNSIFIRFNKRRLDRDTKWRAVREFMPWGSPLVIDLSFLTARADVKDRDVEEDDGFDIYDGDVGGDENVPQDRRHIDHSLSAADQTRRAATRSARKTAKSLHSAVYLNAGCRVPSALHFTNYDPDAFSRATLLQPLHHQIEADENLISSDFPYVCTPKSHLELFPSSRLLYLSPDSPNELGYDVPIDGDDVCVIGGLNESPTGMTLAAAEAAGIRHARLPLERHVGMAAELSIPHAVTIVNDFRQTGDWTYALRWVPCRFFLHKALVAKPETATRHRLRRELLAHTRLNPQIKPARAWLSHSSYRRRREEIVSAGCESGDRESGDDDGETPGVLEIDRTSLVWPAMPKKNRRNVVVLSNASK